MKRKNDAILGLMDYSIRSHGDGTFPLEDPERARWLLVLRLAEDFFPLITEALESALASGKIRVAGPLAASSAERLLSGKLPFRPDLRVLAISAAFDCLADIQRVVSERPQDTMPNAYDRHFISDAIRKTAQARILSGVISCHEQAGFAMPSDTGSDQYMLSLNGWIIVLRKRETEKELEISFS